MLYVNLYIILMEKSLYSTMNEKGQITIPALIRNKLRLKASNKFEFISKGDSIIMLPVNKSLKLTNALDTFNRNFEFSSVVK